MTSSSTSLSLALPTVMQLEKLWFESFASAAQAQRSDDRSAAIRDSSRRMLRAVKRRVTPQFVGHSPQSAAVVAPPAQLRDADLALRAQVADAERAVQELGDAVAKQRASVLAVVRERADKKLRLLYDAPIAALAVLPTQTSTSVPNTDNLVSV